LSTDSPAAGRWQGIAYGIGMVVLFGLYMPAAKAWLQDVPPLWTSAVLYGSAGVTLALVQSARRLAGWQSAEHGPLRREDLPTLLLGALCGCTASPLLLLGLGHVSGTVGALLGNLEGVFTLLIAVLLGETLNRREVTGAAFILAGGVALSFNSQGGGATEWIGIVAIAASCLAWAVDNMTTLRLSGRDPLSLMASKGFVAGTLSACAALGAGQAPPQAASLVAAAAIGAGCWAASMVCFAMAMRHLGAARVGSMLALAPFVGALGSIVGLGERPTAAILVAGVLMAVGAYWLAVGHLAHSAPQSASDKVTSSGKKPISA